MKKGIGKYYNIGLSVLVGIGVFLFWYVGYPHALSYQEQYQLFLWTGDYFWERVSLPGGFADWFGEFIVQFYYVEWLGALLLALLFVALQRLTLWLLTHGDSPHVLFCTQGTVPMCLSLVPVALILWLMGDIDVLMSLPVAIVLALALACVRLSRRFWWLDILIIPVAYWLIGPMVWVYVLIRVLQNQGDSPRVIRLRLLTQGTVPLILWLVAVQLMVYAWLLPQWPLQQVMTGLSYYRIPLHYPQWSGYDKDMYELIRQDYLVRNERWDEIVKRAGEYQVKTAFWSNCVNLALAEKRLLADRMFDFYQSGEDALIMPRTRDLTSMLPSAEAFWRLGMVNSAQRYMFDTQESILNARKSGRCTKRIAECMIVNGHYQTAAKQLDLLKKSLFYRSWAEEAEALMKDEAKINAHPVYGKLRQLRYKDNFLYSYEEMDKMFGLLFLNNQENKMALDYFMAQMLLKGNLQGFQQYMGAVQQYGGYRQMPLGYQDVMRCIQMQGRVPDSPYVKYVERMTRREAER
ncbi:MAG: hypothetical protein IKU49_00720 [Prevotella sp.]|nr:hypothetical protein [Prevotella sp.]